MRKDLTWAFITREEQFTRNSAPGWGSSAGCLGFRARIGPCDCSGRYKLLEFLEGEGAVGLDILNTFHDEPLSQSCICLAFILTMHVVGDWFCSLSMTIKLSRIMSENRSPIKRSNIYCIEMRVLHPLDDPARGSSGGINLPPLHIEMITPPPSVLPGLMEGMCARREGQSKRVAPGRTAKTAPKAPLFGKKAGKTLDRGRGCA